MVSNELYRAMIDNLCDGVYFVDRERRIEVWNNAAEKITGYKREEVLGLFCYDNILCHIDKEGRQLCIVGCPLHNTIEDGQYREEEVFLRHKQGYRVPVLVKIIPIYEEDKLVGAAEIFTSSSPKIYRDDLVSSLTRLAMTDQLTNLYNRRYGESWLESKFREYRQFGISFCVVYLDLDNFSHYNNTYGHDVGDKMLCSIANSFRHNFRETDACCRWGGEEFIGIFHANNERELSAISEKIRVLVEGSEVRYQGETLKITASVGSTLVREQDSMEAILSRADALMYQSKQKGKNCVTIG